MAFAQVVTSVARMRHYRSDAVSPSSGPQQSHQDPPLCKVTVDDHWMPYGITRVVCTWGQDLKSSPLMHLSSSCILD